MPGRDKTGPRSEGAMSGRGMGDCAGERGNATFLGGFGFGRRRRFGYGGSAGSGRNRSGRYENDQEALNSEIGFLKKRLSWLEKLLHGKDRKEDS